MLEAGGGYLGSTLGAFAFDLLGFQWATVVESGVCFIVTNLKIICIFKHIIYVWPSQYQDRPYHQGDGCHSVGPGDLHAAGKTALSTKRKIWFS